MRLERTQVITLANQKGGCGKTTGSVSLAAALSAEGFSVALVDADPQCNATEAFGIDGDKLINDGRYTLADAYLSKRPAREIEYGFEEERFGGLLSVVPGHRGLGTVGHRLEAQLQAQVANDDYSDLDADDIKNEHRHRLRQSIESLKGHRDIVIIDTPPDLGFLLTTALVASDWVIIPVFPSGFDLKGLEALWRTVNKAQQRFNPSLTLLGVVLGNFDVRPKLDTDILKMLQRKFGEGMFETVIHRSVKHREASVYGTTIFEHAKGELAADQYQALSREVIARLEKAEQKVKLIEHAPTLEASNG